ncbi:MAG: hypothetical protein Q9190_007529 [Brigantiaea leucoxantha]
MTSGVDGNGTLESKEGPKGLVPSHTTPLSTKIEWNTKHLPWRITSDGTAAASAAGLVAPIITMIDRYKPSTLPIASNKLTTSSNSAIIENASGRSPLRTSLRTSLTTLLTRPHTFILSRPCSIIFFVYFSTYFTANTIDTLSSTLNPTSYSPSSTTSGPAKFFAASAVNMSASLYKDSQFARMFGPPGASAAAVAKRSIPKASYILFALRDSLTIFASFNLPPLIAPVLPLGREVEKVASRTSVAQFLAPAGMQFFSTPLHLWGLDLYNRPGGGGSSRITWRQRVSRVGRDWLGSSFARMGRIVPAFGVGGVVNARVRREMMEKGGG